MAHPDHPARMAVQRHDQISFVELPAELRIIVYDFAAGDDLLQLRNTCRALYAEIDDYIFANHAFDISPYVTSLGNKELHFNRDQFYRLYDARPFDLHKARYVRHVFLQQFTFGLTGLRHMFPNLKSISYVRTDAKYPAGAWLICKVNWQAARMDSMLVFYAGHVICDGIKQRISQLTIRNMPWTVSPMMDVRIHQRYAAGMYQVKAGADSLKWLTRFYISRRTLVDRKNSWSDYKSLWEGIANHYTTMLQHYSDHRGVVQAKAFARKCPSPSAVLDTVPALRRSPQPPSGLAAAYSIGSDGRWTVSEAYRLPETPDQAWANSFGSAPK